MKTFFHSLKNTVTYNRSLIKIENIKKIQIVNSFKFSRNISFSKLYDVSSAKKLGAPNLEKFIDFDKFKHGNVNAVNPTMSNEDFENEKITNKKIREIKLSLNFSNEEWVEKCEKLEPVRIKLEEFRIKNKDREYDISKKYDLKKKFKGQKQAEIEFKKNHSEEIFIKSLGLGLDLMEIKLVTNDHFFKLVERTKKEISQKKENSEKIDDGNYSPCSPRLGPFEVNIAPDLVIENKNFHWCSCGLSKKQPFCDRSHKGTVFKPMNFQLAERKEKIYLCGCKLSKEAPFCDFKTCIKLAQHEELIVNKKLELINQKKDKKI